MSLSFGNVPTKATLECVKFTAAALDSELEDFYSLLKLSKVGPVTYEGSQSDLRYGITHEWLQNTKEYWLSKFDWYVYDVLSTADEIKLLISLCRRASEKKINSFPNFKTSIVDNDGLQYLVHFTALFSNRADAIPLVLLHGWPGKYEQISC
jgi:microsomal epoxide hydrolase